MKELKYNQVRDAYHEIFWSLNPEIVSKVAFFHRFLPDVYIQPLPLHNRRLKDRGFNQAEVLAGYISRISGIPLISTIQRKKDNPQQARQKSKWLRYLNTHRAFEVISSSSIRGKTILLFDDVITSGTTVKEVARVLKKAGAEHVFALSLLRD
jgi:ComF family protein